MEEEFPRGYFDCRDLWNCMIKLLLNFEMVESVDAGHISKRIFFAMCTLLACNCNNWEILSGFDCRGDCKAGSSSPPIKIYPVLLHSAIRFQSLGFEGFWTAAEGMGLPIAGRIRYSVGYIDNGNSWIISGGLQGRE